MAGILDSLKSLIGSAKSDSVVGLDIGTSSIKAIELERSEGRVVFKKYGSVATGPYMQAEVGQIPRINAEAVTAALKDLFQELRITTKQVVMPIQSASSMVFVLPLPPVSDRQLPKIVPTEAGKYIPVPLTEVNFDWWRIPTEQSGVGAVGTPPPVEVLVAAIRKETIRFYQDVLTKVQLQPMSYEIETFSGLRSSFYQEIKPVALVDMGASSTRISVVEYGIIRKSQVINRGAEAYSDAIAKSFQMPFKRAERLKIETGLIPVEGDEEKTKIAELLKTDIQFMLYEIKKVILAYEKERGKVVDKVVLMGGGAQMKGMVAALQEVVNIPVDISHPFNRVQTPEMFRARLEEIGPEFAVALGAALKQFQA